MWQLRYREDKHTRKAILGLVCLLGLPGAVVTASAQDTVKIGLLMAYTGQFTNAAAQMDDGIKLYMKQHGDVVAGKKIELIRKDTAGAPDQAKRLAQELFVNDHVDILAGFVITPEALAVAELATEAKKLTVVTNAATSIITLKSPYIVRSSLTLPQNCEVLGTWAFQNGVKKVFTLVSDYAPGLDAEAAFQRAYTAAGGEIIGSVRVPLANPDFSAFVQRAKDFRRRRHLRVCSGRLTAAGARQGVGRARHGSQQDQDHGAGGTV